MCASLLLAGSPPFSFWLLSGQPDGLRCWLCRLCKALDKLQEVNDIAWGSYLPGEAQAAQLVAATAAQQHSSGGVIRQQQRQANGRPHGDDSAMSEPLLPPGDGDGDVESGQAWSGAALGLRLDSGCVSGMLPAELEVHELKSEKVRVCAALPHNASASSRGCFCRPYALLHTCI